MASGILATHKNSPNNRIKPSENTTKTLEPQLFIPQTTNTSPSQPSQRLRELSPPGGRRHREGRRGLLGALGWGTLRLGCWNRWFWSKKPPKSTPTGGSRNIMVVFVFFENLRMQLRSGPIFSATKDFLFAPLFWICLSNTDYFVKSPLHLSTSKPCMDPHKNQKPCKTPKSNHSKKMEEKRLKPLRRFNETKQTNMKNNRSPRVSEFPWPTATWAARPKYPPGRWGESCRKYSHEYINSGKT